MDYVKVLHVEDNELDASIYRAKLEASVLSRFLITRAKDLGEAREKLDRNANYDIILLDLNLPDSEGLDTLESMLEIMLAKSVVMPITVLSGIIQEEIFKKALGMGAASFLIKTADDYDVADHLIKVVKKYKGKA